MKESGITESEETAELRQTIEHMQQELAGIRETDKIWRGILESSLDAIIVIRMDGSIEIINTIAAGHFGLSEEEITGRNYYDLLTSEVRQERREKIEYAFSHGRVSHWEDKWDYFYFLNTAYPVKDGSRAVIVSKNITEQKLAEEALQESEEKYRSIVEMTAEWIWEMDLAGRHSFSNPGVKAILGYPPEEFIGQSTSSLIHAEDWPEVETKLPRFMAEKRGWRGWVLRWRHKDGSYRYLESNAGPIINAAGELVGYRGSDRDITERKQAEVERAKLQDQLVQAQKMESVGRLAGGVAHDFNNMLGVILGHAEIAMDQVDPAQPLHSDLEEICKAASRSADLTRQLLAFARKQPITPQVLDLNETVAGMLKMLQRLIGENINLNWHPSANLWPVNVDPSQIDQILANLCVNARGAIADVGKITIETGNGTFDEDYCSDHAGFVPGDFVRLAVSDNGCGMDQETLAQIFEPFFTTKGVGQGTGLGLATVYGAVKQNNGFINVYSERDQGTTFKIYLPRHQGKAEQPGKEELQEPARGGHETILVVEDEPALLDLSKLLLELQGYRVLAAGSANEAIRLAEEHSEGIHLLMTDVVMPEMNGLDLAKKLLSLHPHLQCLFTSGYTANVIAHHGILDEGVHFIQKPFSRKDLTAKIREALDQKSTSWH